MPSRIAKLQSDKFNKNVELRGNVPKTIVQKKSSSYPLGPWALGFLVFVVVGSSVFQLIRSAQTGQL